MRIGTKIFKGVTILLSLTVFLNMVAETMPATSDAVPLLGNHICLQVCRLSVFRLHTSCVFSWVKEFASMLSREI